jgi:hypothetical protein
MSNPFIVHENQRFYLSQDEIEHLSKLEFIKRVHKHPARRGDSDAPFVLTVPFEQVEKLLELR